MGLLLHVLGLVCTPTSIVSVYVARSIKKAEKGARRRLSAALLNEMSLAEVAAVLSSYHLPHPLADNVDEDVAPTQVV